MGSMLSDVLVHFFCHWCALTQEAHELGWGLPNSLDDVGRQTSGDGGQTIERQ
jgi:hypothetical protein